MSDSDPRDDVLTDKKTEFDCPSCASSFNTEHGMKVHHTQAHGESLAKVVCECEYCGSEFEEFNSRIEKGRGKYCSKECKHAEGRTEIECVNCGKKESRAKNRQGRYSREFCSKDCYLETRVDEIQSMDQEDLWMYEGGALVTNCSNCESEIELYSHRLSENNFCSEDCKYEFMVGENNPAYVDGTSNSYRGSWATKRLQAINKSDKVCERCGMSRDKHYDVFGFDLNVHHKTRYREFDDPKEANKLSNLMVLCHSCHKTVEAAQTTDVGIVSEGNA